MTLIFIAFHEEEVYLFRRGSGAKACGAVNVRPLHSVAGVEMMLSMAMIGAAMADVQ